eukprot:gene10676-gene8575
MQGVVHPVPPGPMKEWRLYLKHITLLDMNAVLCMETARSAIKDFLLGVQKYFDPETDEGFATSRSIEPTQLSRADIQQAVEMGKFEAISTD